MIDDCLPSIGIGEGSGCCDMIFVPTTYGMNYNESLMVADITDRGYGADMTFDVKGLVPTDGKDRISLVA